MSTADDYPLLAFKVWLIDTRAMPRRAVNTYTSLLRTALRAMNGFDPLPSTNELDEYMALIDNPNTRAMFRGAYRLYAEFGTARGFEFAELPRRLRAHPPHPMIFDLEAVLGTGISREWLVTLRQGQVREVHGQAYVASALLTNGVTVFFGRRQLLGLMRLIDWCNGGYAPHENAYLLPAVPRSPYPMPAFRLKHMLRTRSVGWRPTPFQQAALAFLHGHHERGTAYEEMRGAYQAFQAHPDTLKLLSSAPLPPPPEGEDGGGISGEVEARVQLEAHVKPGAPPRPALVVPPAPLADASGFIDPAVAAAYRAAKGLPPLPADHFQAGSPLPSLSPSSSRSNIEANPEDAAGAAGEDDWSVPVSTAAADAYRGSFRPSVVVPRPAVEPLEIEITLARGGSSPRE